MVEIRIDYNFVEIKKELILGVSRGLQVHDISLEFIFKGDKIIMRLGQDEFNKMVKEFEGL